jgi:putative transposase
MKTQEDRHSIATMSRVLEVSRSGFYAWAGRRPSRRAREDSELGQRIQNIHEQSRGTYGAPRIHAELAASGMHVGRKRVARLMRGNGIRGVCRRKWTTTTVRDRTPVVAPDLVKRDFRAQGPNQLWVADITYVPTWSGFLYLAVVLDAWSRRVVGWAFAMHLRVELVLAALEMAVRRRQPRAVIHHSDKGSTRRWHSALGVVRRQSAPRWEALATPTTTRCASRSSRLSSAS